MAGILRDTSVDDEWFARHRMRHPYLPWFFEHPGSFFHDERGSPKRIRVHSAVAHERLQKRHDP